MGDAAIGAGGQVLSGIFGGLAGGHGQSGMLQQQPNPFWNFYQSAYPAMLMNAMSALGDNTYTNMARSNPEFARQFTDANGGNPLALGYGGRGDTLGYRGSGGFMSNGMITPPPEERSAPTAPSYGFSRTLGSGPMVGGFGKSKPLPGRR